MGRRRARLARVPLDTLARYVMFSSLFLSPLSFQPPSLSPTDILPYRPTATAADTAANVTCDASLFTGSDNICSEAQAAEAFSFLAWIVLLAYWVLLLVFAIRAGHSGVWTSGVHDAEFAPNNAGGQGAYPTGQKEGMAPTTYPPQHTV